jgi:hypothetical protein
MPRTKMLPPLPETLGNTEQDRFENFAKAILSVSKSETVPQHITTNLPVKKLVERTPDKPILHPEQPPRKRDVAKKRKR